MAAGDSFPGGPASKPVVITPSDPTELNLEWVRVGTGGDLVWEDADGNEHSDSVSDGEYFWFNVYKVKAATIASGLKGKAL